MPGDPGASTGWALPRDGALTGYHCGVVGGSIAGLCQAVVLQQLGAEVTVWERIPQRGSHPGAGIVAQRELLSFVADFCGFPAARIGVPITARQVVDRNGRASLRPRRQLATSWSVLHHLLSDRLPADCYRDGVPVLGVVDRPGDGVEVNTTSGSDVVDLVVVADGSRSGFRGLVSPAASFEYAGYVALRGTLPESDLGSALARRLIGRFTVYDSQGTQFLCYAIPGSTRSRADAAEVRLLNWVWYEPVDADLLALVTIDRVGKSNGLAVPVGMLAPDVMTSLLTHAEECLPQPFLDIVRGTPRPFLQVVSQGRVDAMRNGAVLLSGDAAFTVRPHAGSATTKAAVDAAALHHELSTADIDSALQTWEDDRLRAGREMLVRTAALGRHLEPANRRVRHANPWTGGTASGRD
ncbi:MAG: hypothetical protein ACRCSN_22230 [Dermatophilaceae bacterium]